MDGFKRPKTSRKLKQPVNAKSSAPQQPPTLPPLQHDAIEHQLPEIELDDVTDETPSRPRKWRYVLIGILLLLVALAAPAYLWYQRQLQPVDPQDTSVQRVEITEGASLGFIASRLEERGLIRSGLAFKILANLEGKQGAIKAGTCNLSPNTMPLEILNKITTGCQDFKSITFYPGATLETSRYARERAEKDGTEFRDMSIRASLKSAGYSNTEISEAFSSTYSSPLFEDKPSNRGYEGYIFGETYYVSTDATVKEVLQTAFDHFYDVVKKNNLAEKYQQQGLSLYEGITLASIVGRELDCEGKPDEERKQFCFGYQRQIAEVFYNRLRAGMTLGSDVTSIYASDRLNVESSIDVDSPYNTRKYQGLPPGPIATAGVLALKAVADPTVGDNLYFLAGDDGLIYFANDSAGHESNIVHHCKLYCGDL